MRRSQTILIWAITFFAIACFAVVLLYFKMTSDYQKKYLDQIQGEVISILGWFPYDQRNIVFVCIDGLRYSEGFGAEDQYIPHIWNDLRPEGTIFTNYRDETATLTTTVHSTWLAGNDQFLSNSGDVHPTLPTFIELYRDARDTWFRRELEKLPLPSKYFPLSDETRAEVDLLIKDARSFPLEKTYCIVGKDRILDSIDYSSHPGFGLCYDSSSHRSMPDSEVYNIFDAKLLHDRPKIIFMNLAETDEEGHSADWGRYTHAITRADEIVWKIWNKIQESPIYRDKTDLFIMSDHGRHDDAHGGFAHHGDRCDGCLHVPALMLGPDFKKGAVVEDGVNEYDIHPTIARIMGFETPMSKGRVLEEAMVAPQSFPKPIETERTAELKEERKKYDADSASEWYQWADTNKTGNALEGVDEFPLMVYLTGLVEGVTIGGKQSGLAQSVLSKELESPAAIIPAIKLSVAIDDEQLMTQIKTVAAKLYEKVGNTDFNSLILDDIAVDAPSLCVAGAYFGEDAWVKAGTQALLDRMVATEGDVTLQGDTNDFISRFDYFSGENSMYTIDLTPREKAMFIFASGLALEADNEYFDETGLYLLKRNFRLQMAFAAEDIDEYCLYDGENGYTYPASALATNFLYDAIIATQTPWVKEEFVALGYGPEINQTPLSEFPAQHYFYILNQGNAFLNSRTNFDKLRVTINWDDIFNADSANHDDAVLALGAALMAGARWDSVGREKFTFNMYPPEWGK